MRKWLLLLESGLLVGGLALAFAVWQQKAALEQPLILTEERLLEVPSGATPGGLLNRLQGDGLLRGSFWLRLYWRFNLSEQGLRSGEYRLAPGMTAVELLDLWQRGEVVQYNLTLVEGWSFRQVRAALARADKLDQSLAGVSDAELMTRLGLSDAHPEGRFFPDTYRYVRGMSDFELLKQAHARLQQVLAEEWAERSPNLPYATPYEALIMASIIEKETGVPHERQQIAGVFVRRLEQGMLLQTDPTVIYGLGERYNGKLGRADLLAATPYNTYLRPGLPPTPIALPGREAIHAALHPADGRELYFVARGDGSHVFSETLEAHNQAVREYQLKRRADYRSSPSPEALERSVQQDSEENP
ncbi:endolytic transglycosylase MltG [Azotobacter chroococcum]|uniref:endolytic transglycosylase MltG n=1 Tax=Azotobacter chroococcum TaxID=353 RepID=UPI00103981DE|nr:endolytic transglycosylase MltG [Azotobacter chroococcum]TBW02250.1 endolytic transglycosylase MltG [Azotobacter chroococcum]